MGAVVAERAAVVEREVGVVICRIDVRVELTGRVLERAVVVTLQLRPHVAGEELVVVAEALLGVELHALVLALGLGGRGKIAVEEAGARAHTGAGIGDEVVA